MFNATVKTNGASSALTKITDTDSRGCTTPDCHTLYLGKMIKYSKHWLFSILMSVLTLHGYSQKLFDFSEAYGYDQVLYNGELYRFTPAISTTGSPLLYDRFNEGTLYIRGNRYPEQLLNLDIFNNHVILQFYSRDGGVNKIIVSEAWLERVELNGAVYEPVILTDSASVICQVIKSDSLKVVYNISKEMILDNAIGATNMKFSNPERTSYITGDHKITRYTGNRTFLLFFDDEHRQEIKRFMRKNKINVKRAGDEEILTLLKFCDHLI